MFFKYIFSQVPNVFFEFPSDFHVFVNDRAQCNWKFGRGFSLRIRVVREHIYYTLGITLRDVPNEFRLFFLSFQKHRTGGSADITGTLKRVFYRGPMKVRGGRFLRKRLHEISRRFESDIPIRHEKDKIYHTDLHVNTLPVNENLR